jgi:peptidoglycan/xylan/chitin deacetylase (PgdA/CDA1 family)
VAATAALAFQGLHRSRAVEAPGQRPADRHAAAAPLPPRNHNAEQAALARLIPYGSPVFCGGGTKPLVALTFDDGPGPNTRHTLKVLRRHGARGTFFVVAREVTGWPGLADVPRKEAAQGAVGNHTYDHVSLPGLSADQLQHEVGDALTLIGAAAGRSVRLFRPPYGAHDPAVDAKVRSLGMLEVLWSVESGDSSGATADQIVDAIRRNARAGSIVLLHENRGTTRNALPRVLDVLREKGLSAVTVPELLSQDPPSVRQLRTGSCAPGT